MQFSSLPFRVTSSSQNLNCVYFKFIQLNLSQAWSEVTVLKNFTFFNGKKLLRPHLQVYLQFDIVFIKLIQLTVATMMAFLQDRLFMENS